MESFNCPNCNEHIINSYERYAITCKCFYKFQIIKDSDDLFMFCDMFLNEEQEIILSITKKEKYKYELIIYENSERNSYSYFFDEFSKENIDKVKHNMIFL